MPDRKEKARKPQEISRQELLQSLELDAAKKAEIGQEMAQEAPAISERIGKKKTPEEPAQTSSMQTTAGPVITPAAARAIKEIEEVLSENLEDIYLQMSPMARQQFKIKGEETAQKIYTLLQKAKIKVKEILRLIKVWLATIPGVSKFFLEQEAKIRTEKVLRLKQK